MNEYKLFYAPWTSKANRTSKSHRIVNQEGREYMRTLPSRDPFPNRAMENDYEHEYRFNKVLLEELGRSKLNNLVGLQFFATYCYDVGLAEYDQVNFDINLAEGFVTALFQPYFRYKEFNTRAYLRELKPTEEEKKILKYNCGRFPERLQATPEDKLLSFNQYKANIVENKDYRKTLRVMYLAMRKDLEQATHYKKNKEFIGWVDLVQKIQL